MVVLVSSTTVRSGALAIEAKGRVSVSSIEKGRKPLCTCHTEIPSARLLRIDIRRTPGGIASCPHRKDIVVLQRS
jgi:hypothetical protein